MNYIDLGAKKVFIAPRLNNIFATRSASLST